MANDEPASDPRLSVEVVYATPDRQVLRLVEARPGITAYDAVRMADFGKEFPKFRPENLDIAIWGRKVMAETLVRDGDRVEVLRPLEIDPREARRTLAESGKVMGDAKDQP